MTEEWWERCIRESATLENALTTEEYDIDLMGLLHTLFKEKPTFKLAREIWIEHYETSIPIQPEVLEVFAKGIKKQAEGKPRSSSEIERREDEDFRADLKFIKEVQRERGEKSVNAYLQDNGGEAAKRRYYRALKKLKL